MSANDILQELGVQIFEPPLSQTRDEAAYPDVANSLHLAVLLLDCDTEIAMNGMLGFLENFTGQHLGKTIDALRVIGATAAGDVLCAVRDSMHRHGVTWERLRGDFKESKEYEITSFEKIHGDGLTNYSNEISEISRGFSLLSGNTYELLCKYLDDRLDNLQREIEIRKAHLGDRENGGELPSGRGCSSPESA